MSDSQSENHDRRPLLPSRQFVLRSWFTSPWSNYNRRSQGGRPSRGEEESSSSSRSNGVSDEEPERPATRSLPPEGPSLGESSQMAAEPPEGSEQILPAQLNTVPSQSSTCVGEKICLICLEPLTPEDFESGEALVLQCDCRGQAALRHRSCAQKWVNIKGDLTCDVCRSHISNLAPPQLNSDQASHPNSEDPTDGLRGQNGQWGPSDVFDCIRMTWIITIICVLFFDTKIPLAFVIGLVLGVMYTWSCQLLRCTCHRRAENDAVGAEETENNAAATERQDSPRQEPVPTGPTIIVFR